MNYETTIPDLTSAILEVRSYFAKRGVVVKVTRKKALNHFTTCPTLPILIKEPEPTCFIDKKRLPINH